MVNSQALAELTMNQVKQSINLILAIALLNLIASCQTNPTSVNPKTATNPATQPRTAQHSERQELQEIKVCLSWLLQGTDAPLTVAIAKGYFESEGIKIKWERGFGNVDTIAKLSTGQFDLGFSDMYNMIEYNLKYPERPLVAIAVPFNKAPFSIITLKKSGIETPQQLAGKVIGSPAGDGPRRLWPLFAKQIGIDPNSVTWTTIEPKLRETFLVQAEVDAISGFGTAVVPNLLKAGIKREDINIFYYTERGLNLYGNSILVRKEFAEENPELVKGFVRAYLKGLQDTIANPEAALATVQSTGDALLDIEAEKLRLKLAIADTIVNEETKVDGLGSVNPQRLEKTIQQTVEGFGLSTTPAIKDVFDGRYLPPKQARSLPGYQTSFTTGDAAE